MATPAPSIRFIIACWRLHSAARAVVADALGRADVTLPLTAPRVWELLEGPA